MKRGKPSKQNQAERDLENNVKKDSYIHALLEDKVTSLSKGNIPLTQVTKQMPLSCIFSQMSNSFSNTFSEYEQAILLFSSATAFYGKFFDDPKMNFDPIGSKFTQYSAKYYIDEYIIKYQQPGEKYVHFSELFALFLAYIAPITGEQIFTDLSRLLVDILDLLPNYIIKHDISYLRRTNDSTIFQFLHEQGKEYSDQTIEIYDHLIKVIEEDLSKFKDLIIIGP